MGSSFRERTDGLATKVLSPIANRRKTVLEMNNTNFELLNFEGRAKNNFAARIDIRVYRADEYGIRLRSITDDEFTGQTIKGLQPLSTARRGALWRRRAGAVVRATYATRSMRPLRCECAAKLAGTQAAGSVRRAQELEAVRSAAGQSKEVGPNGLRPRRHPPYRNDP